MNTVYTCDAGLYSKSASSIALCGDPLHLQRHREVVVEAEDRVGLVGGQHRRVVLAGDQFHRDLDRCR